MSSYHYAAAEVRNTDADPRAVFDLLEPVRREGYSGWLWRGTLHAHTGPVRTETIEGTLATVGERTDAERFLYYVGDDTAMTARAVLYEADAGELYTVEEVRREHGDTDEEADYTVVRRDRRPRLREREYDDLVRRLADPEPTTIDEYAGRPVDFPVGDPTRGVVTEYLQLVHGFHALPAQQGYVHGNTLWNPWFDPVEFEP